MEKSGELIGEWNAVLANQKVIISSMVLMGTIP